MVLEKTLESSLDSKEIQPVHPKGNQSSIFIGRTDVEAETPVLWPPDGKSWLIWKDPDAGKDWRQVEKGTTEDEMVGWHHQLNGHAAAAKSLQSCLTLCKTRLLCSWDSPGKNTGVGCHFLLQCMKVKSLSRVRLVVTPWTVAHQVPPSMRFSRQEYWSGVPLPSLIMTWNMINMEIK